MCIDMYMYLYMYNIITRCTYIFAKRIKITDTYIIYNVHNVCTYVTFVSSAACAFPIWNSLSSAKRCQLHRSRNWWPMAGFFAKSSFACAHAGPGKLHFKKKKTQVFCPHGVLQKVVDHWIGHKGKFTEKKHYV